VYQLTDGQKVTVGVSFQSAGGNPANVDGAPSWSVSNSDVLDLTVSENGMSATISAKGPVGTSQLIVKADADLGAGLKEITGVLDIEVVAGEAAIVVITPGQPEPK